MHKLLKYQTSLVWKSVQLERIFTWKSIFLTKETFQTRENLKRFFNCRSDTIVTYILEIQLTSKFFSKDFNCKLQNMYLTPYFTSFHLTFVTLSWKFLSFFLNSLNVILLILLILSNSPPYKGSSQIWLVPDFMNIHD